MLVMGIALLTVNGSTLFFIVMAMVIVRLMDIRAGRAFLDSCSRVPGVLGTRARGNAIFFKARGNAEREEIGTLILRASSKNAIL